MRRILSVAACLAIAASAVVLAPSTTPAQATTAKVAYSADRLPTWQADGVAWAVASAGGRVVVGGGFSQLRPPADGSGTAVNRKALAVLDATTGAPTGCVLDATVSGGGAGTVRAALTAPDQKTVYVGGNFTAINGTSVSRLAAIDPVSCSVLPFRVGTIPTSVWSLALRDNKLFFGGAFSTVDGQARSRFAAVNATTGQLLPWKADAGLLNRAAGVLADGFAVAVSPDGTRVALGGEFDTINGADSHALAIVDSVSGQVARAYPAGFIHRDSVIKALTTSGTTLVSGNEGSGGGVFDGRFALSWSSLNEVWRDECLGATQAVLVQGDTLYSANHAHDCSSEGEFQDGRRVYLVAQDLNTGAHHGWEPRLNDGINENIGPRALAVVPTSAGTNALWAVGEFTEVNGRAQQSITRFGTTDTGAVSSPNLTAEAMDDGTIQVRLRTVVDLDDESLTYRIYRNDSTTPIWTGTSISKWYVRPQITFVDRTAVPGTWYGYRVTASDGPNTSPTSTTKWAQGGTARSSYEAAVLRADPTTFWRWGEPSGTWLQDSAQRTSGRARTGLAERGFTLGTAGAIRDEADTAITFNGSTGYVWNDQLEQGPGTYTVQTWFKTTSTTGGKLIGFGNGRPRTDSGATVLSGNYDRHIYMENGGRLNFGAHNGATRTLRSAASYNDGAWHQVVASQGSGGMRLFVDGVQAGSNAESGAQAYAGVWHVGGDQLSGWPNQPTSNFFAGSIDETAIFDRSLSAQEIVDLYRAGGGTVKVNAAPTDKYGAAAFAGEPALYWRFDETTGVAAADASYLGSNTGAIGAQVQLGQTGRVNDGRAFGFTGTQTSGVSAPQTAPTKEFSTELWVKSDRGGKLLGFENVPTGNGSGYDKHIYMDDTGRITFGTHPGGVRVAQTQPGFADNRWHHVVGTQGASGMALYVDGVLRGTNSATTSETGAGYWRAGGGNLGGWPNLPANSYFTGSLDEVAVYPKALSQAEVTQHYSLGANDTQAPGQASGLKATVAGGDVTLTWGAAVDDTAVTGYQVHRGKAAGFVPGASTLVGNSTTTSYTDADVTPGDWYYTVVAVDAAGNVGQPAPRVPVVVEDTTAPSAPTDPVATVNGDAVTLSWAAASDDVGVTGYAVHRSADAAFRPSAQTLVATTQDTKVTVDDLSRGVHYFLVTAGDAAGQTSEPSRTVRVEINDLTAPSAPTGVTAAARNGDVTLSWSASSDDVGVVGYEIHRGETQAFQATDQSRVGQVTSTTFTDPGLDAGTWWYRVLAVDAAGNRSSATSAVSATVTDSQAPTTVSGVATTVTGSAVKVTWSAATDDGGGAVTYRVHRASSQGFTPGASSLVATTTSTSATESDVPAGTWWYRVVAVDTAGNSATPSTGVAATVQSSSPSEPVEVSVPVKEDAMVAQVNASYQYGSLNQISARGAGSSLIESYLKFDLPAAPAGTRLSGAELRVRTSNDSTAASTGTQSLRLLSGAWTESSVTWATRPTGKGSLVGTFTGATATSTAYTAELDPASLAALGGKEVSLVMENDSTDNVRLWSKESGSSLRPELVLTYTQQ